MYRNAYSQKYVSVPSTICLDLLLKQGYSSSQRAASTAPGYEVRVAKQAAKFIKYKYQQKILYSIFINRSSNCFGTLSRAKGQVKELQAHPLNMSFEIQKHTSKLLIYTKNKTYWSFLSAFTM